MALNMKTSRKGYSSRCTLYKHIYVNNNSKLVPAEVPSGIFYSKDKIPYKEYINNKGFTNERVKSVTIETNDFIPEIEVDDFVKYDGEMWRVHAVEKDDLERNKLYSSRPATHTTIELRH